MYFEIGFERDVDIQIKEAQRTTRYLERQASLKLIVISFSKANQKERVPKVATEKCLITYKENPITLTAEFSAGIL